MQVEIKHHNAAVIAALLNGEAVQYNNLQFATGWIDANRCNVEDYIKSAVKANAEFQQWRVKPKETHDFRAIVQTKSQGQYASASKVASSVQDLRALLNKRGIDGYNKEKYVKTTYIDGQPVSMQLFTF